MEEAKITYYENSSHTISGIEQKEQAVWDMTVTASVIHFLEFCTLYCSHTLVVDVAVFLLSIVDHLTTQLTNNGFTDSTDLNEDNLLTLYLVSVSRITEFSYPVLQLLWFCQYSF